MTDMDRTALHHARLARIIDRLREMSTAEHARLLEALPYDSKLADVSAYDHHRAMVDALNAAIGVVIDLGYHDAPLEPTDGAS